MSRIEVYAPGAETLETLPFDYRAVAEEAGSQGLRWLSSVLKRAGLRADTLRIHLGLEYANRLEIETLELRSPLPTEAVVASFFVAGCGAGCDELGEAGLPLEWLFRLGFAEEVRGFAIPRVSCLPVGEHLVLCEPPSESLGRDLVAAPDLSAYHLIAHARRPGSGRWLDLATGTGVVGIAGSVGELHGADPNDRALAFAQVSSWMNGLEHAGWHRADLFCGVPDGLWNTITFNPPLVEIDEEGRDEDLPLYVAGPPGLCERFWRQVGDRVAPGGWVVAHTALPDDPDYPRSLALRGAFSVAPFTLGVGGDTFCITCWQPDAPAKVRRQVAVAGERPPRGAV